MASGFKTHEQREAEKQAEIKKEEKKKAHAEAIKLQQRDAYAKQLEQQKKKTVVINPAALPWKINFEEQKAIAKAKVEAQEEREVEQRIQREKKLEERNAIAKAKAEDGKDTLLDSLYATYFHKTIDRGEGEHINIMKYHVLKNPLQLKDVYFSNEEGIYVKAVGYDGLTESTPEEIYEFELFDKFRNEVGKVLAKRYNSDPNK